MDLTPAFTSPEQPSKDRKSTIKMLTILEMQRHIGKTTSLKRLMISSEPCCNIPRGKMQKSTTAAPSQC